MLAAVTRSPGEMVIEDVAGPGRARAGYVLVRPEAVGICGSDFHLFSGDVGALSGARDFYPRVQGHEVSAVVEDRREHEQRKRRRPGCDLAAAAVRPLLPVPFGRPERVHKVPAGRRAPRRRPGRTARGPGRTGLHGRRPGSRLCPPSSSPPRSPCTPWPVADSQPGEQVVVFGAGPIGLATLIAAVSPQGARVLSRGPAGQSAPTSPSGSGPKVVTWAPEAELKELAREWTKSEGAPLVVETSGEASVLPRRPNWWRRPAGSCRRHVVRHGTPRPGAFPEKEIDSSARAARPPDFRDADKVGRSQPRAVSALFSHHFPLARAAEAFEFAMSRPPDAIKIVVTVN